MAAIKALQQWCKIQCEDYRDVSITNMTTSFRDGLAFCALIHKHRADLINFDSLRKENVYENNKLAFSVAEEKLGIPALLDAEDMVALRVPDRLSILTYVSQYYNYFHGRSPIGGMGGIKRQAEDSKEQPFGKKNIPVVAKPFPPKAIPEKQSPPNVVITSPFRTSPKPAKASQQLPQKKVLVESSNKQATLTSTCVICKHHVHLVQRHLVDGKLYHRSCFKCNECGNILISGTYKAGPKPGTFICTTHQSNIKSNTSLGFPLPKADAGFGSLQTKNVSSPATQPVSNPISRPVSELCTPISSPKKPAEPSPITKSWTASAEKTQAARQRFFQSSPATTVVPPTKESVVGKDENEAHHKMQDKKEKARTFLSKKLLEENTNNNNVANRITVRTAENRFGGGKVCTVGVKSTEPLPQPSPTPNSKEKMWLQAINKETPKPGTTRPAVSPADWRTNLKPVSNRAEPKSTDSTEKTSRTSSGSPAGNTISTTNASKQPTSEGPKKASPKIPHKDLGVGHSRKDSIVNSNPETESQADMTNDELMKELCEIEESLNELEKHGVELEQKLRRCEEDGQEDLLDELMVDWFTLIRNKQVQMRRESELVYLAKTQELEQQQPGVEEELRRLMNKPEYLKTATDRRREEVLMEKLLEIVNDRNAIIEGLDEDRLREQDEDQQLDEMMQQLGRKKNKTKKESPIKRLFRRKSKNEAENQC